MTVLAAEGAAGGAAAGGTGAAGAGAAGAGGGGAAGAVGQAAGPAGDKASKGVLLAIAIILLWLAGLCLFIAFEGSQLLAESAQQTGGGFLKAMITGLAQKALNQEQGGG